MSATNSAVLTALFVTGGRWAKGDKLDVKVFVGAAVYFVGLSVMSNMDTRLAQDFGLLVLVGAVLVYGVPLMQKLGLLK